jgi:transposase
MGDRMKRFIEGEDRKQVTLLPECLDDFVAEDNPVRIIEAFVEELDLGSLGFDGAMPSTTGHPSYHPAVLLKIYIYGYLNRVQSSRRLERECQRNVELMWLTGRLAPDFKTIADFRRDKLGRLSLQQDKPSDERTARHELLCARRLPRRPEVGWRLRYETRRRTCPSTWIPTQREFRIHDIRPLAAWRSPVPAMWGQNRG